MGLCVVRGGTRELRLVLLLALPLSEATRLPSAVFGGAIRLERSHVAFAFLKHWSAVCPFLPHMLHAAREKRRGSPAAFAELLPVAAKAAAVAVLFAALLERARCWSSRYCSERTCVMASL